MLIETSAGGFQVGTAGGDFSKLMMMMIPAGASTTVVSAGTTTSTTAASRLVSYSADGDEVDPGAGGHGAAASSHDPLYVVVPMSVIYATIFVTGLVGNVSTCIVIARNRSMHTATNYYLFSLAVSDLLLLVSGLPPEMYYMWSNYPYVFGEVFCVLTSFAAETSANATVLTITAFTIERYVAICHPFLSHTMSKLSRAVKYVMVVWLLALGLAVPQAIQFGVTYKKYEDGTLIEESARCSVKESFIDLAFEMSTILFFLVPMSIITILYILIGIKLRNTKLLAIVKRNPSMQGFGCTPGDSTRSKVNSQKNVIRMLVAVVVAFFICWAPFHAQRLLVVYAENNRHDEYKMSIVTPIYRTLTYISGVFYYLSTTVNPILYNLMSNKFREAFKAMLLKHCSHGLQKGSPCRPIYSSLPRYPRFSAAINREPSLSVSEVTQKLEKCIDCSEKPRLCNDSESSVKNESTPRHSESRETEKIEATPTTNTTYIVN